jgi:hypothetical protein
MPLEDLTCDFQAQRDATILRSVSTLKRINFKLASNFWGDVSRQLKWDEAQQPK